MKGILLAAVALICHFAVSLPFLRAYRGRKPYKTIQASFAFSVLIYILLFRLLPDNLGFLPPSWTEPHASMDFFNGLLLMIFLSIPYQVAYYLTAFISISTQVLVLVHERGPLTAKDLLGLFGFSAESKTEDPVTAWRLTNLLRGGYIERSGGGYRLRWKGRMVAKTAWILKRIVSAGEAGG